MATDTAYTISLDFVSNASLDELLSVAREQFQVEFEPLHVDGQDFDILQISNMAEYIEKLTDTLPPDQKISLPFWAKIWPSSILLSYFVRRLAAPGKTLLEIGGGVGLTGLAAAAAGFKTVITDIEPSALLFARINILQNNLEDRASVQRVDFCSGVMDRRFDVIAGAELLYREDCQRRLTKFLVRHLEPTDGAEAIISRDYHRNLNTFFKIAREHFHIQEKTIGMAATNGGEAEGDNKTERSLCTISRLTPKKTTM